VEQALTGPFLAAAAVLLLAGVAKLRSPGAAAQALRTVGLPGSEALVRALAVAEVVLAIACLIAPAAATAGALACAYAAFAVVAVALVRQRAACGCFGDSDRPASWIQAALSVALSLLASAAAVSGVHGIGWIAGRSAIGAAVLVCGVAGLAYGAVLVYTELPRAWGVWEP
jgi:hypothetical protein